MHFVINAITALVSAQVALSSPVNSRLRWSPYAVKETHFVPRGFSKVGNPSPDHVVNLKIGLKSGRYAEIEKNLYEVSDPSHPRYGKHLSKEEVEALIRPQTEASELVNEWLEHNGVESHQCTYSPARNWVSVSLPVAKVEQLLDTKYSIYKHEGGESMVRTTEWSLPQHLHRYISTIQPTTAFLRASPKLQTVIEVPGTVEIDLLSYPPNSSDLSLNCNFEAVTPRCLRVLYGLTEYVPQAVNQSRVGFTNYLGEIPSRSDTALFLQNFRPEAIASAQTYEQVSIAGGPIDNGTGKAGLEGNLDIETISGLVWPIPITSYSTGGSPPFNPDKNTPKNTNEPYLTWLEYVQAQTSLPQVISTSYGDDEQSVPFSYAQAVCDGFAELGLRGITLLFSSGDNGVGENGTCISNDGKNTTQFLPEFPASCPYITAVGGTKQYPEVVAYDSRNGYVSGSGFSNYFPQPWYQRSSGVVDKYIAGLDGEFDGLYNRTGRAYPDLAAQGYRYLTVFNATVRALDGTSCSAPATAGILSLLNDALLSAGRPPLGFLNPWLYSRAGAEAFTDVVNGSSIGCDTAGFSAGPGWDVASGWGTPQFPGLMSALGLDS